MKNTLSRGLLLSLFSAAVVGCQPPPAVDEEPERQRAVEVDVNAPDAQPPAVPPVTTENPNTDVDIQVGGGEGVDVDVDRETNSGKGN